MERIEWKGDFLGFTFDGVHSSSLGIVRTSDGSRYNENLLPEFEDKTVKVPGRDETYYFGSEYKQRIFEVKIAFDNMTDKQFRQLRQLMSGQELKDLIFDEVPYKVYKVKANGVPNLSYIAFDEEYRRIYKGEGTLSFIAYFPFARSRFKYREDYTPKNIPEWGGIQDNKMAWLEASGIPSKNKKYTINLPNIIIDGIEQNNSSTTFTHSLDEIKQDAFRSKYAILLNNSGDINTNLKFTICSHSYSNIVDTISYQIFLREVNKSDNISFSYETSPVIGYMKITIPNKGIFRKLDDSDWWRASSIRPIRLIFDSYSKTIIPYYYKPNNSTDEASSPEDPETELLTYGDVRNDILVAGDFFDIPPCNDDKLYLLHIDPITKYNDSPIYAAYFDRIEYNYLYY